MKTVTIYVNVSLNVHKETKLMEPWKFTGTLNYLKINFFVTITSLNFFTKTIYELITYISCINNL